MAPSGGWQCRRDLRAARFLASRQLCGVDCPIADFALTHDALYVVAATACSLGLDGESVPGYGEGGVGGSVLVAGLHDRDYLYGPGSVYRLRSLGSFDASFGTNGTASLGEDDRSDVRLRSDSALTLNENPATSFPAPPASA